WGSFGYKVMVSGGAAGRERAQHLALIDSIVAALGEAAHPAEVWAQYQAAKMGGAGKAGVRAHLSLMQDMTSAHEYITDVVARAGVPVIAHFESKTLGPEAIVGLEMAVLNALNRPRPGKGPIWFIVEEGGKHALYAVA